MIANRARLWKPARYTPPWSRGVMPLGGGDRVPVDAGREAATQEFSELAAKFPVCMTIAAEFTQLTLPGTTITAGNWLLFTLIDFDPWARLQQDIVIFGIWMDMLSTNPSPATPLTQAAWGDTTGLGAAVVVGDRQIPGAGDGQFSQGVLPITGIDSSVTLVTSSVGRRFFKRSFPTGKLTTGFNRRGLNGAFVPFVQRITQGNRLRSVFILNRADANTGGVRTIDGAVEVEVYAGLTQNPVDIAQ